MSEETRKNAEINDNELEQVSGGGMATSERIKQGDCPERNKYDPVLETSLKAIPREEFLWAKISR